MHQHKYPFVRVEKAFCCVLIVASTSGCSGVDPSEELQLDDADHQAQAYASATGEQADPAFDEELGEQRRALGAGEEPLASVSQALSADDCALGYNCKDPTWTYTPSPQNPSQHGATDYCKNYLCGKGEGDCDSNSECASGMVCVFNRGSFVGLPTGHDICWPAADVCNDLGPCRAGEGDCDLSPGRMGPRECGEGLVCEDGAGHEQCTSRSPQSLNTFLSGYSVTAPGFAAAVFDEQGMIAIGVRGVSSLATNAALKKTDKFHFGSNTKAVTATLAAALIEDPDVSLSWSTPYSWSGIHSHFQSVGLEQYLGHRAGVAVEYDHPAANSNDTTRRRNLTRSILDSPRTFAAGTYNYSNANFDIAATIIEQKTGKSYRSLVQEYIFDPLGMASCGWGPTPAVDGHYVRPMNYPDPGGWTATDEDNPSYMDASARMHCNLEDYGKFLREHLRENLSALLDDAAYVRMHDTVGSPGNYQAGWQQAFPNWAPAGQRVLNHFGSNTLNMAGTWLLPGRDLAIVVVANSAGKGAFLTNVAAELSDIAAGLAALYL